MDRFAALVLLGLATNLSGSVVDVAPQRGRAIPSIKWWDETGRDRQLSELTGYPVVLLPIYTRCRTACVQNVDRLKETLADSSSDVLRQSRVLLFSFDAGDNAETLSAYRRREKIPLGWSIGAATQSQIDLLLDSLGVQVGKAGREFAHPNILLFLDAKLRIAKWIYGTDYTRGDIDSALQIAQGRSNWIGRHSEVLYAFLLFGASILCVMLLHYVRELSEKRRASLGPSAYGKVS